MHRPRPSFCHQLAGGGGHGKLSSHPDHFKGAASGNNRRGLAAERESDPGAGGGGEESTESTILGGIPGAELWEVS